MYGKTLRYKGTKITYVWHVTPKTEINRLYAIVAKTDQTEFVKLPREERQKIFERYEELRKRYVWGGPNKPYYIKKRRQ